MLDTGLFIVAEKLFASKKYPASGVKVNTVLGISSPVIICQLTSVTVKFSNCVVIY
jgi:hypothetical protein